MSQSVGNAFEDIVRRTCLRAFKDLLTERVGADPPDYDWICPLYGEIRGKMISLLRKGSSFRVSIEEKMDSVLFEQMLRHQAFETQDLRALVAFIFDTCRRLGSPGRDEATMAKEHEIVALMNSPKGSFKTVVPLLILNANECLDNIYEDLAKLPRS